MSQNVSKRLCLVLAGILVLLVAIQVCASNAKTDPVWRLRLVDGSGFGEPNNNAIARVLDGGEYLYVSTWSDKLGCRVYRSRDGEEFEAISPYGINGNKNNFTALSLTLFRGKLYASTWNERDGGYLARAKADRPEASKISWETITADGFGNKRNTGFCGVAVFKDQLYVGCFNAAEGPEIWRSATGNPGSFSMIIKKGFGEPGNSDITTAFVYEGYLYIGTETIRALNKVGCQLWRTDGNLAPPYDQWELVNTNGFGNPRNHNICGLAVLDGKLYASTWNFTEGMELWRATPTKAVPFADWEKVNDHGFGLTAFKVPCELLTLDGVLYLGGVGFSRALGEAMRPNKDIAPGTPTPGFFFTSTNGTTWNLIKQNGFMEYPLAGIHWVEAFRGKIYLGGYTAADKSQLWVYEPTP